MKENQSNEHDDHGDENKISDTKTENIEMITKGQEMDNSNAREGENPLPGIQSWKDNTDVIKIETEEIDEQMKNKQGIDTPYTILQSIKVEKDVDGDQSVFMSTFPINQVSVKIENNSSLELEHQQSSNNPDEQV